MIHMKGMLIVGVVLVGVLALGAGWYVMNSNNDTNMEPGVKKRVEPTGAMMKGASPTGVVASPTGAAMTSVTVKEFVVEGSNFKFVPAEMKVKKGDTVRMTFKNIQGLHDFTIEELDVATNQINGGDEEEVEFVADKAGTFEYYCSVGNHRAMGMKGKLIVE